jgi:quercetin dioxygenase-like cupin family protein
MTVIRHGQSRRTRTPNGVITTLASPTQGGADHVLWRVDMAAGQAGPPHAFDTEQLWTLLVGGATVELDGETFVLTPGDTMVLPADAPRRVSADPTTGLTAIVAAPAGTRAYSADSAVTEAAKACATPDGDKLVPAWVV